MRRRGKILSFFALMFGTAGGAASSASGDAPQYAEAFTGAFQSGYKLAVDEAAAGNPPQIIATTFRTLELGRLKIVSGKIAACDPFVQISDRLPFVQTVPNGDHAVKLAIVEGGINDGRIAYARVDFSTEPAVTWKMALLDGQDSATLKEGEIFGYPVDAGTGAFYDPKAGTVLAADLKRDENAWEAWQIAGEKNGKDADLKPNFFLMLPAGELNVAMFASGWGDGFYASYFGYSRSGEVVALVTDFAIIDWDHIQH